ncbi:MAG: c-type cytochrome domain-containing protein, partial [Candidatus Limnocylindrus sp.]
MRPLPTIIFWTAGLAYLADLARAATLPGIEQTCFECHDKETAKGDVDLSALPFDAKDPQNRERWAHVYDVIVKGEMPPKKKA